MNSIKTINEKLELNQYQIDFITTYGSLFSKRGRSENFGRIFALLTLVARSPDHGLNQKQIKKALSENIESISISTVSRNLKNMEESGLCNSVDEDIYKAHKRYYVHESMKLISLNKIKSALHDAKDVNKTLTNLKQKIPIDAKKQTETQELIEVISKITSILNKTEVLYEKFIEDMKDVFGEQE